MATLVFDKPSYNVGDVITVTVTDPSLVGLVETESDSYTEADGTKVTVSTTIKHPGAAVGTLVSSSGRVYTRVSVTGDVIVYTTTA